MYTDPIADYLTRVRNAVMANHKVVEIPASNLKKEITKADGYSLITILNQTRKGDHQRYKIYIYPSEIIIAKIEVLK